MMDTKLRARTTRLIKHLRSLEFEERIQSLNEILKLLHAASPFANEPVGCVQWVKSNLVTANDYNPNVVAPPEMKLLEISIESDGYTQPIVTWERDGLREVVDGFHRHRVGKECREIASRLHGYLPVVTINADRSDKTDRIAATIRHNRARGKHQVDSMSDIVVELKRRNWSDAKISRELGMEQDEILRLCQITGLAELFSDSDFSKSWDVEGEIKEEDFVELTDDISTYGEEVDAFRTVNTGDENRIFHTYEKWECYKAGFYNTTIEGMTKSEAETAYRDFLSDSDKFSSTLDRIITEWEHSCQHYLTNEAMNRIAWLGQAAACYEIKIPSTFRAGFHLLTPEQQYQANMAALTYLNRWLTANNRHMVTLGEALGQRQSEIY